MCKVGGPRCDGSHTPSTAQRARRKANTAYRNAVADAVLNTTGDDELARRVKHASMTDLHDIVAAGGYDAEAIAKKCGTATYTSPDGETATVDVTPAGNTRRTPVSDETRELLEDIDGAMGSLPGGFYRDAVLKGDRDRADELRAEADQIVSDVLNRAATIDLDTATDDEIETTLTRLNNLDAMAVSMRGRGVEFNEDDGSFQAFQRVMDEHARRLNKPKTQQDVEGEPDPTVYDNGYLDVDGIASGTITVTPDNADEVADKITDEVSSTDVSGLSDDEFDEFYDRINDIDDKLRAAGHDGVYELANLADELDYRNQNEDDKYEFGDEYQRQRQLTNWAYDTALDHQPEGMEFGMWRAAQYLENDEYFTGADNDGIDWAERVLRDPDAYDKFEVGVAQNAVDKREWKALKSGAEDVSSMSDAQVEDYERRLNDLDNRMKAGDSPLLSTDYEAGREVGDLHQRLLEEKLAREGRAEQERAAKESKAEKFWREREERLAREAAERKARGGAGMGGSTFSFSGGPSGNFNADGSPNVSGKGTGSGAGANDTVEEQEGETWSVGTVVWAPTKGDTFARVVSLTDKSVTLEEMETSWDAPSGGRQKYSPGAPTGRKYRRQIQRNAAGDMTCKAGPTKSSAMMVKWG